MASFALASVEKDYKVDMFEGQVTLGRGPHLQITDKRVSRNHAIIEVSGSSMTILPIHSNPTFYKARGETKFIPLEKDQPKELQNGDCISFLPDDLIFRVEKNKKNSITEYTTMEASNVEDLKAESSKESFEVEKSDMCEEGDDMNTVEEIVSPLKKTRVLPGWMTKNKGKESKEYVKKGKTTSKNMKRIEGNVEEITEDSVQSPAKDKVGRSLEVNEQETSDKKDDDNDKKVEDDDAPLETEEQESHVPKANEEDKKRKRDGREEDEQPSKKEKKLPQCPYGVSCYRKNPVHFQEYSHSDDSGSEEEPRDDDPPECPYGEMCYRKNPRHRKAYKHTPQPKTRERRAKKKAGTGRIRDDDDGGPNDYDYDDSFIDDYESSPEPSDDEDSDWQPPDEDDDEGDEEDVSELLNDAKNFTQNKKMLKPT